MSLEEVAVERFAELFHHYLQALKPEGADHADQPGEWTDLTSLEKSRLITAARLALTEVGAKPTEQEDRSRYFAKPGRAEWGC